MGIFHRFTLLLANLLLPCALAQADTALSSQQPRWQGHFDTRGQAQATLRLPGDTYVHGVVSGATRLDSQRPSGEHLRRLVDSSTPVNHAEWQFMTSGDAALRLVLSGPPLGAFSFTLDNILLPAQQTPWQETPLSPTIARLQHELMQGGDSEAFWRRVREQGGTPLVEAQDDSHDIVTFLWRGARHNVFILGAPSGDHDPLLQLGASDVWYRSYRLPKQAFMSYKLAPDVPWINAPAGVQRRAILTSAQQDPLNPRTFPQPGVDRYQTSSAFALAQAPVVDAALLQPGNSADYVTHTALKSAILHNQRRITLYRHPGQQAQQNIVVLFDGQQYQDNVGVVPLVHNLIAQGKLPPLTLVLIDNIDSDTRSKELPPNAPFTRFLQDELMPWLQHQGIHADAQRVTVAGSSYGGLAAANAAFEAPQWFGNVLSLSGSYWWSPEADDAEWLPRQFARAPTRKIALYLEAGLFEGRDLNSGLLANNRHFYQVLLAKGYPVHYVERASGHDYLSWRTGLAEGLIWLYNKQ